MAVNYMAEPSPLRKHFGHLQENQLDIRKLVCSVRNLLILAKPVIAATEIFVKITRWEFFWGTVATLFICNVCCILLPSIYSTLAIVLFLLVLFGLGLSHQKYRILVKAFPTPAGLDNNDTMDHHECIQEFHLLVIIVDEFIMRSSNFLLNFYSVLKLDDWNFSLKCYGVMFAIVMLLFLFPLRIAVVLLIDLIIVYQPVKEWVQLRSPRWTETESELTTSHVEDEVSVSLPPPPLPSLSACQNVKASIQSDDAVSQSSDVQVDPGFGTDSESSEKLPDESSSGDEMVEVVSLAGDTSVTQRADNRPEVNAKSGGVVGRFLDLKKRRPSIKERCTGCGVMFTTILKRRHVCNHCGNYFCSRCCSYKVPRATFGATAPAAQTETVAVCIACYSVLTGTGIRSKVS